MNDPESINRQEDPTDPSSDFCASPKEPNMGHPKEARTNLYINWLKSHMAGLITGALALAALWLPYQDLQESKKRYEAERLTKVVDALWGTSGTLAKESARTREAAFLELILMEKLPADLDYSWVQLSYINFTAERNADIKVLFKGANLENANLLKTNLSGAQLQNTNFNYGALFEVDLRGANLKGATFVKADLTNADLSDADLTGADFTIATLIGATFTDSILTKAKDIQVGLSPKRKTLTCKQIKAAKTWKGAKFDIDFLEKCPKVKAGL